MYGGPVAWRAGGIYAAGVSSEQFAVIGAGVIGLSTALVLQEEGHAVTVYADRPPLATTSAKAGASFKPHEVAEGSLTDELLRRSWARFLRVADDPASGVRLHTHWEAGSSPLAKPSYLSVMQDVEEHVFPEVPGGYAFGRCYRTFLIDMPVYLRWMLERFRAQGGALTLLAEPLRDIGELTALPHDVVINCSGLGARELCRDALVYPIRGQVAMVGPQPQLDFSISADGFYIYPRSSDTVIGGTVEPFADSERPDPSVTSVLVRAACRVLPGLSDADVLRTAAGLRPYRHGSVRLEPENFGSHRVVHNYGHGGSGVTLSWGSAEAAVELAR